MAQRARRGKLPPLLLSVNQVVDLIVQPRAAAQGIRVEARGADFFRLGENGFLSVYGTFPDGIERDIRNYNTTYASNNAQVVVVNPYGRVEAVGPGRAIVTVTHGSLSTTVPVRVGVFEERGDLDGNQRIDQLDVNIVTAAIGTPPTGPGDPRDLNSDGQINAADEQEVRNLCSRPNCATLPHP
jgi:hypothetical protein